MTYLYVPTHVANFIDRSCIKRAGTKTNGENTEMMVTVRQRKLELLEQETRLQDCLLQLVLQGKIIGKMAQGEDINHG